MSMRWKVKCLAFHIFGLPGGRIFHRRAQKHLGTWFRTVNADVLASYQFHLENYRGGSVLEIGAGSDLLVPLLLSQRGATAVYAYDLEPLATTEQVNHVIRQLRDLVAGDWPEILDLDTDLKAKYRIDYRAPANARRTGLPDGSIDFICSTSVLEHIPVSEFDALFAECRRVASPACVMSHNIGYIDHYAHADRSISYFNFYQFSDWQWRLFNPSMQYQNRLRHSDFEALFARAGLMVSKSERLMSPPAERVPAVPLHPKFRHYTKEDLFAHDGLFVLHCGSTGASQVRSVSRP
jgi:hypothetical protein